MPIHHVHAFSYELREGLVARLTRMLTACGAWVADQNTLSDSAIELLLEIRVGAALDLYVALAKAGVELTLSGQQSLTLLCSKARYPQLRRVGEVVTIRLELRFLEDASLQSLLTPCASMA